jgi:hypothetical protein
MLKPYFAYRMGVHMGRTMTLGWRRRDIFWMLFWFGLVSIGHLPFREWLRISKHYVDTYW